MSIAELPPLTIPQVARCTGESEVTVGRWIAAGHLRLGKDGRIDRAALVAFCRRLGIVFSWALIEREMTG